MIKTIEIEIDESGQVHTLSGDQPLPQGRALLTWQVSPLDEMAQLSEASLAQDWLRPEEDEAWTHLQPAT